MKRWIVGLAVVVLVGVGQVEGQVEKVDIEWVPVGDAGNLPDIRTGHGGVDYTYHISKYEVTNAQYAKFLSAVAATDEYGLYSTGMGGTYGGIQRSGTAGSYTYSLRGGWGNKPVNFVTWWNALRFANWLHNGQPGLDTPVLQDEHSTEDGAYTFTYAGPQEYVRKADARVFLPSEDEWYKAAYYKGGGTNAGYWYYATQSDSPPTSEPPPGTDFNNGSANYAIRATQSHPKLYAVGPPDYISDVGAYDAKPSNSAYDTYDQDGNVREWTEGIIQSSGSERKMGGTSWNWYENIMRSTWEAIVHPYAELGGIGFRVATLAPEPCPFTAGDFEPPMGKKKKIGSTLPMKFQLFFDDIPIQSQVELDAALEACGHDPACPEIVLYDVTDEGNQYGIVLPDDGDNVGEGGDLGSCFRFSDDGKCIYNLRLDSPPFAPQSSYLVQVLIGNIELSPGNELFQTK